MRLKERIGLLKSGLLYYGNPAGLYRLRQFYRCTADILNTIQLQSSPLF